MKMTFDIYYLIGFPLGKTNKQAPDYLIIVFF
jgi:hypothetical protein